MNIEFLNTRVFHGGILVFALIITSFLNFLFNAILGRYLTLAEFSVLTLINTLWFFIAILLNSFASVTNNRTAYLSSKRGAVIAQGFRGFILKKTIVISIFVSVLWIIATPVYQALFHVSNPLLFLSMVPAISLGVFAAVNRGYFQGVLLFRTAAVIILSESISKLVFALIFIALGLAQYAYLSIPLSIACSFIFAFIYFLNANAGKADYKYIFPRKLLYATLLTFFSSMAFLSIDLLLARHFLSPNASGVYSLLSLVGKMIFFFGSLLNVFILTLASRDTGLNKNTNINFYKIFAANVALSLVGFIALGIFGSTLVPLLFGTKSIPVLIYLTPYSLGILFFTIANSLAVYHLAKQQFIFAANALVIVAGAVAAMIFFHSSIHDFVNIILYSSFIYFSSSLILHVFYKDVSQYYDEEDQARFSRFKNILLDKISVSICVPAFNEGANIGKLVNALLSQKTKHIKINKIVIVSSASTDKTDDIVRRIMKKDQKKILLVRQLGRHGKAAAINSFLKRVDDPIVVVQSADTLPRKDTIEKLCRPFLVDGNIGMTGGSPYPVNDPSNFLGFVIHTWWWFHRHIPRFGEIIAFRNIIPEVSPRTAVDEAYIQAKFAQMGYKIVHVPEAKIYNKGAENINDIIKQRRRIFNGHTRLLQEEHVHISNVSKSGIKLLLFDYKLYSFPQLIWLFGGMLIEVWANILGRYDKYVDHKNPVVWEIASSTKDLSGNVR